MKVDDLDEERTVNFGVSIGSDQSQADQQSDQRSKREVKRSKRQVNGSKQNIGSFSTHQVITLKPGELLSAILNTSQVSGIYDGIAMTIKFEVVTLPWENETMATTPTPDFGAFVGRDYVPHKFQYDYELSLMSSALKEDDAIFVANG